MNEKYKEVIIPNSVEVIYTVLRVYNRFDSEMMAECNVLVNNISPNGIIVNNCGQWNDISLKWLKMNEKIN